MYIKQDMNFNDLMNNCWSGAIDTLKTIEEHDKENELMELLEEQWLEEVPTMTEINDYLWFEDEAIFEALGISEAEEEKEDVLEENESDFLQYTSFDSFCAGKDCNTCPFFHYVAENEGFDCEKYFNQKYNMFAPGGYEIEREW